MKHPTYQQSKAKTRAERRILRMVKRLEFLSEKQRLLAVEIAAISQSLGLELRPGPACGHSTCSQNYIDTGNNKCVHDDRWPHCSLCGSQFIDRDGPYLECDCGKKIERPAYSS